MITISSEEFVSYATATAKQIKMFMPRSLTAHILEEWAAEEIREKLNREESNNQED